MSALGYQPVTSELLELDTGEEFVLEIRLAADAIPLEPITVVGRSRSSLKDIALRGFYDRRDAGGRIGLGRFLDRGDIEALSNTKLTDVLMKVPGLRVARSGSCVAVGTTSNPGITAQRGDNCGSRIPVCRATLCLDGQNLGTEPVIPLDRMIPVEWVEAIEVYRRPSELPAEFMGMGSGACGVIAIWTRRG